MSSGSLLLFAQVKGPQPDGAAIALGLGCMCVFGIIMLIPIGIIIAGYWKIFTKAGEPGWASIVPIYNGIVLLKIAGKPWFWIFLCGIPVVGLYFAIVACIDLAKNFGKETGFAIGLVLLPFIFFPILGFGSARYRPVTGGGGRDDYDDRPRRRRDEDDDYDDRPRR